MPLAKTDTELTLTLGRFKSTLQFVRKFRLGPLVARRRLRIVKPGHDLHRICLGKSKADTFARRTKRLIMGVADASKAERVRSTESRALAVLFVDLPP